MPEILYVIIPVAIVLLVILATGYVKASPDRAYIISGLRKKPKVLIGKAGIKIPFLEKKDELSLQLIPIDVKTSNAVPTADYININVDAAVNVKISDKPDKLALAAQNFLNRKPDYIAQVAREVLEGNMREIVGKMNLEEMVSDRQKFANLVKENAEPDLGEMGLDIVSFNVQNFVDGNGVIENLGVDNIVKIQMLLSQELRVRRKLPRLRLMPRRKPTMHRLLPTRQLLNVRMSLLLSRLNLRRNLILRKLKLMQLTRFRKRNSVKQLKSQLLMPTSLSRSVRLN